MKSDRRAVSKVSGREKEESVTQLRQEETKKGFTAKLWKIILRRGQELFE